MSYKGADFLLKFFKVLSGIITAVFYAADRKE